MIKDIRYGRTTPYGTPLQIDHRRNLPRIARLLLRGVKYGLIFGDLVNIHWNEDRWKTRIGKYRCLKTR